MSEQIKPVSRFWACCCASSIFALLWTQKMKKTRMWLLICILPQVVIYVAPYVVILLIPGIEDMSESAAFILIIVLFLSPIIILINSIYFMYQWTSEYNLQLVGSEPKETEE